VLGIYFVDENVVWFVGSLMCHKYFENLFILFNLFQNTSEMLIAIFCYFSSSCVIPPDYYNNLYYLMYRVLHAFGVILQSELDHINDNEVWYWLPRCIFQW